MKKEYSDYVGIADCHGVESFIPINNSNLDNLKIRAMANDQRHAVVYKVTLNSAQVEEIMDMLETAQHSDTDYLYKQIIRKFKAWANEEAINIGLGNPPINLMVSNKKMWKKIPNSKLDPWR